MTRPSGSGPFLSRSRLTGIWPPSRPSGRKEGPGRQDDQGVASGTRLRLFNWIRQLGARKSATSRPGRMLVMTPRTGVRGKDDAAQTAYENRRHWAAADHLSANAAVSPDEQPRFHMHGKGMVGLPPGFPPASPPKSSTTTRKCAPSYTVSSPRWIAE